LATQTVEAAARQLPKRRPLKLGSAVWRCVRAYPVVPGFLLFSLVMLAVTADLTPFNPTVQSLRDRTLAPGATSLNPALEGERFLLGADQFGRDVLTRIMHGARLSLTIVAIVSVVGIVLGTAYGLAAGYFGGLADEVMLRLVDMYYAIPFLLLALVTVIVLGKSMTVVIGLLALQSWPPFVRVVRAEVLSLKERDYVMSARVCGASARRIMLRHLLPGVINTIIVIATLRVGQIVLTEAILSFLGAGISPPRPAWGLMTSEGRNYLNDAWWIAFYPGLAIFALVVSLNFIGDWFRDRFDPRLRQLQG
jgi:peptide/nickel transport system permease protein